MRLGLITSSIPRRIQTSTSDGSLVSAPLSGGRARPQRRAARRGPGTHGGCNTTRRRPPVRGGCAPPVAAPARPAAQPRLQAAVRPFRHFDGRHYFGRRPTQRPPASRSESGRARLRPGQRRAVASRVHSGRRQRRTRPAAARRPPSEGNRSLPTFLRYRYQHLRRRPGRTASASVRGARGNAVPRSRPRAAGSPLAHSKRASRHPRQTAARLSSKTRYDSFTDGRQPGRRGGVRVCGVPTASFDAPRTDGDLVDVTVIITCGCSSDGWWMQATIHPKNGGWGGKVHGKKGCQRSGCRTGAWKRGICRPGWM